MAIVFLINICILYCVWDQIKVGIVLLKVSGLFMQEKPQIVAVGFLSMIFNIIFVSIFIIGYIAGVSETISENNSDSDSRTVFETLIYFYYGTAIFFGYFLYYLMVFVLATAVAYWYYRDDKSVLYGYKSVGKNIGSLTFASTVITFITVARMAAQEAAQEGDGIEAIICCLIGCCLSCI